MTVRVMGEVEIDAETAVIAGELTVLMREIDTGFFCTQDRAVADDFWNWYLKPEIERLFTTDVVFHSHFEGPTGRSVYHGTDGLRHWADDISETFSRFERLNENWEGVEDRALLVHQRIQATGRDSGTAMEMRAWVLWKLEDGRITELHSYADRYEAVAAAGEMPVPIPIS